MGAQRRVVAACALVLGLLSGCGTTTEPSSTGHEPGFPATISGYLGSATIAKRPQRVVTLANGDTDAAIALGVTPVGMAKDPGSATGVFPWLSGKIDAAKTTLLDTSAGVPLEQIAALHPDLILATNALDVSANFAALSKIAPTVTRPTKDFSQSWQDTTTLIARALGRPAQGAIGSVNRDINDVKRRYPALAHATFSAAWVAAPGRILVIKGERDMAVRFLHQVGLSVTPKLASSPSGTLSEENVGDLDADVVLVTYSDDGLRTNFERRAQFRGVRAVRDGRYLPLSMAAMTQLRSPTAAGIPWLLRELEPEFAKVHH